MKYFFILGSNPTLSIAEIAAFFRLDEKHGEKMEIKSEVLVFNTDKKIDAVSAISRLGGTIKVGEIMTEIPSFRPENALPEIMPFLSASGGKYKFGISYYGRRRADIKKLAMEIKNHLRARGINSRWVTSKDAALSSVVVTQNKLTENGIETILIADTDKLILGRTLAVQPFKELSRRDYGRPARDDASGMLPPKLAMIMINLARIKPDGVILDPFCGSGTILSEAMLMGYRHLIGADISEKAVEDARKNMEWTKKQFSIFNFQFSITVGDVTRLSGLIGSASVDAIVTEPYLGPQRGRVDISKTINELEKLYSDALKEFKKILKPEGWVVMIWPIFIRHGTRNTVYVNPNLRGFKIIDPIPELLRGKGDIKVTARKTIIYGRPGQKVWREVVILRS